MDSGLRKWVVRSAIVALLVGMVGVWAFLAFRDARVSGDIVSVPASLGDWSPQRAPIGMRQAVPLAPSSLASPPPGDTSHYETSPGKTKRPPRNDQDDDDLRAETRLVVIENSIQLATSVEAGLDLLEGRDPQQVLTRIAPDEQATLLDCQQWLDDHPQILTAARSNTVKIFTIGDEPVYFGFAVVVWTDNGVTSKHTIAFPLRLIDGGWYLSTFRMDSPGLKYMQSVQI